MLVPQNCSVLVLHAFVVEKVDHIFRIFPTPRDTACSKGLVQEFSWQLAPIAQGLVTQFSSQSMGEPFGKSSTTGGFCTSSMLFCCKNRSQSKLCLSFQTGSAPFRPSGPLFFLLHFFYAISLFAAATIPSSHMSLSETLAKIYVFKKQDAAHEPECSHAC